MLRSNYRIHFETFRLNITHFVRSFRKRIFSGRANFKRQKRLKLARPEKNPLSKRANKVSDVQSERLKVKSVVVA